MANSRMYLTCRHCGAQLYLAKGYYGEYSTRFGENGYLGTAEEYLKNIEEFFAKHAMGSCSDDPNMVWCNDNARLHFMILEEGEEYNPNTNTIESVFVPSENFEGLWYDGKIKVHDEFEDGFEYDELEISEYCKRLRKYREADKHETSET